ILFKQKSKHRSAENGRQQSRHNIQINHFSMQDPSNIFQVEEEITEQMIEVSPEVIATNGNGHELARFSEAIAPTKTATPIGGILQPIPPLQLAKKLSSGRYAGSSGSFKLELRV